MPNIKKKVSEPKDDRHPFASNSSRFPIDDVLRKHGFRIISRRKGEQPLWERSGELYRQSEALNYLRSQDLESAKSLDRLLQEGDE
ncbi:MAG: hypothetical protein KGL39_00715 [Patescibacteria group bacterium]|nr:hypothetical protein [Patescibacteria group bacterium]